HHPEYTDVLWDRSHTLDYRDAVRGPGGAPIMRNISAIQAEGPFRAPHAGEATTELLAAYLSEARHLTGLGFDEWLRQLGSDAFEQKGDGKKPRGILRRDNRVPDRLRAGFIELGYRKAVEADPPLEPHHPAEVARRLHTRQVRLPDQRRPQVGEWISADDPPRRSVRPSHHQLEVFQVDTAYFGI